MIAGGAAVDVYPSPAVRRKVQVDLALP
jgi:hypothetical protein